MQAFGQPYAPPPESGDQPDDTSGQTLYQIVWGRGGAVGTDSSVVDVVDPDAEAEQRLELNEQSHLPLPNSRNRTSQYENTMAYARVE